jgi:tetratricopeptide (TPR) repeat protein
VLFDLQSPRRRRVIRVTFGALAAVFAISFVFLGVGSGGGFSVGDIFGTGGGETGASAFEDDINAAEQRIAANPNDSAALAQLVTLHYQAGTQEVQVDQETGQQSLTSEGKQQFEQSVDAWSKYLKQTGEDKAAQGPASIAYQAYFALAQADFSEAVSSTSASVQLQALQSTVADLEGAGGAQRVVALSRPNAANWAKVAEALYLAGDAGGAQQAIAEATKIDPKAGARLEQQLKGQQQQGERFTTALDQLTKQQQQVQSGGGGAGATGGGNPLSGLGTGGVGGTGGGF